LWDFFIMKIEKLTENHWQEVAKIYQDGIDTKDATFRTQVPDWKEWMKPIINIQGLSY